MCETKRKNLWHNKIGRTPHRSSQFIAIKISKRIFTHFYIQGRRAFERQCIEVLGVEEFWEKFDGDKMNKTLI